MRGAERGCKVAEAFNHHPQSPASPFVALTGIRMRLKLTRRELLAASARRGCVHLRLRGRHSSPPRPS